MNGKATSVKSVLSKLPGKNLTCLMVNWNILNFLFETFAVFLMLYDFFWVIPWLLNFIWRRFETLRLFHLHRQVGAECHCALTCLWREQCVQKHRHIKFWRRWITQKKVHNIPHFTPPPPSPVHSNNYSHFKGLKKRSRRRVEQFLVLGKPGQTPPKFCVDLLNDYEAVRGRELCCKQWSESSQGEK